MIPSRIKEAIEASPELNEQLLANGLGLDWKKFNRTVFDFIARRINRKITAEVIITPALLFDKLIIGKDQLNTTLFEKRIDSEGGFIEYLKAQKRPFVWISGKTLFSYWNKGTAKHTKLNCLLTYLEVEISEWDNWKKTNTQSNLRFNASKPRKIGPQDMIRNYYLGSYYLYYQKSDSTNNLVKAPFTIGLDERGQLYAETVTEGHPYRSSHLEIREGVLYITCENQLFDEKENHIFNVGNETDPEVLFGVSNTISVKKRIAIGIRNVLVKQRENFDHDSFVEREISFASTTTNREETAVLKHFLKQGVNLINSQHCCSLRSLEDKLK